MARYRNVKPYTEEEKMNLKVDIRRIPEWEAEILDFSSKSKEFDTCNVSNSARYIFKILNNLDIYPRNQYGRVDIKIEEGKLNRWLEQVSSNGLVGVDENYLPDFMKCFVSRLGIVSHIESNIIRISKGLAEAKAKGVTKSFWVEIFTSRVSMQCVENLLTARKKYLPMAEEIPKIEAATKLLDEVHAISIDYWRRRRQICARLELAKTKKDAIERYEKKNGNVFAKAAAVDKKTRNRASSLRRLVEKTEYCPYCGGNLGSEPHLDHIYPVSKGGLSIVENLIWCCSVCNAAKTDKGLIQFLKEQGYQIDDVLLQLHALGKHV